MSTQPVPPPPSQATPSQTVRELLGRPVLLVTGKGGVGKSTVAASLARLAARQGKRVLLLELESVSRAAPLFGLPGLGPEPVEVGQGLSVASLDVMDSLRFFATDQLKVQSLVSLALRNKAVAGFFEAVPAIKPILFLYHLWRLEQLHGPDGDGRWDLIVCDLPTSGFAVGMYAIPKTLSQVFRFGPVNAYAAGMRTLLTDPRKSGVVLVTLPEEMPVVETLELQDSLRDRFGVRAAAIVLNGVFPDLLDAGEVAELAQALERQPPPAEAVEDALALEREVGAPEPKDLHELHDWLWAAELLAGRRSRAQAYLPRLREAAGGRVVELPFLFRRELPLEAIDHLAGDLASTLRGSPA